METTNNNCVTYFEYTEKELQTYHKVKNIMDHNDFVRLFEYTTYSKYKTLLTNDDIDILVKMLSNVSDVFWGVDERSLIEYILQNYLFRVKGICAKDLYDLDDLTDINNGWFLYDFEWSDLIDQCEKDKKTQ